MRKIFRKIAKMNKRVNEKYKQYGVSKLFLWVDYLRVYIFYGFSFMEYDILKLYKFRHNIRKNFVNQAQKWKFDSLLNDRQYKRYFNDKVEFNKTFNKYIKRKWLYCEEHSTEEIADFIINLGSAIVKPLDQCCGRGIHKLTAKELELNSTIINELKNGNYLIEEIVENHGEIKKINDGALNTVRICTIIDKSGKIHIFRALLRMSKGASAVDNWASGGIVCKIDVVSGCICSNAFDKKGQEFSEHPDTNVHLIGLELPLWEECKDLALSAASTHPKSRFIGWDIAITENGIELIEGNYSPNMMMLQIFDSKGIYKEIMQFA